MKGLGGWVGGSMMAVLVAMLASVAPATAADSAGTHVGATRDSGAARTAARAGGKTPTVTRTVLIALNRAFPDYSERIEAKPRERFPIGDTEYSARIVEFQPAFTLDLKTRKVSSYSREPENPAFRIIVEKSGVPEDTTWAFMNMPPHFARNSLLAFLIQRVEFSDHAPVEATKLGAPPKARP